MAQNTHDPSYRRVYFITHPRVASNLLVKILNLSEQNVRPTMQGGYFFKEPAESGLTTKIGSMHISKWTAEEYAERKASYERSFEAMNDWMLQAEADQQVIFVKEHAPFLRDPVSQTKYLISLGVLEDEPNLKLPEPFHFGANGTDSNGLLKPSSYLNDTVLSDEYLLTFTPTFLIRHPALVFPSFLRALAGLRDHPPTTEEEQLEVIAEYEPWMTFHWIRRMLQFFVENAKSDKIDYCPLILDADDIMSSPDVVREYAAHVGLDPEKLIFEWNPITDEQMALFEKKGQKQFVLSIFSSKGIRQDKSAAEIDVEAEKIKWKSEFGQISGTKMAEWVTAAMGDYEFMRERRLKPGQAYGQS